jgi:hypothetical protein
LAEKRKEIKKTRKEEIMQKIQTSIACLFTILSRHPSGLYQIHLIHPCSFYGRQQLCHGIFGGNISKFQHNYRNQEIVKHR